MSLEELGDRMADLSFWIEGWDQKTRFDKNILLDFSKYSIQLNVEGTDPVWVYDTYNSITNYLKNKTAWYCPDYYYGKGYCIFYYYCINCQYHYCS